MKSEPSVFSIDDLARAPKQTTSWDGVRNYQARNLLREALNIFYDIREVPGLKKKPSTSELLDWLKLLMVEDMSPDALRSKDSKQLIPPLHGALLKNEQDVHLFERLAFMARREQRQ